MRRTADLSNRIQASGYPLESMRRILHPLWSDLYHRNADYKDHQTPEQDRNSDKLISHDRYGDNHSVQVEIEYADVHRIFCHRDLYGQYPE